MTRRLTAELTGAELDLAVAIATGDRIAQPGCHRVYQGQILDEDDLSVYSPSTDWGLGGPILDLAQIDLLCSESGRECMASYRHVNPDGMCAVLDVFGPTMLVAAMRAFVASKLGPEVDLP